MESDLGFLYRIALYEGFLFEKFSIEVETHSQLDSEINTKKGQTKVKEHIWRAYRDLRVASNKCRYSGFSNEKIWNQICKGDFTLSMDNLKNILKYVKSKGVDVDIDIKRIEEIEGSI